MIAEDYTKIQVSAKIYWGFNIEIPNKRLITMSKQNIIDEMINFMKTFFAIHNLGKNFEILNKYSYSFVLLIWLLSNQIFL